MSWFSKKRNILSVVIVVVMVIVAAVGVIWGVTHHTEGGRLAVCWNAGVVQYENESVEHVGSVEEEHGDCAETEDIIWSKTQIPITVQVVTSDGELSTEEEDIQVVTAIVRDYNAQVGFEFYRLSKAGGAYIRVHPNTSYDTGGASSVPGWATHSKRTDGRLLCDIHIRGGLSVRYAYQVGMHEFGHCAGLEHDPNYPSSLMYPFSADDTESDVMSLSRITDNDVGLHSIYR